MRKLSNIVVGLVLAAAFALSVSAQTFSTANGTKVDLAANRGKVVVLAVGATWLPLSAKQAEYANTLARRYSGKDVVVYFVATDSNVPKSKNYAADADITKFATANRMTISVLRDSDGAYTLKEYRIDQLPSFVILDKQGRLVGDPFGGIDPKFDITVPISKEIDRLLK